VREPDLDRQELGALERQEAVGREQLELAIAPLDDLVEQGAGTRRLGT
jgi:hypothetical protein